MALIDLTYLSAQRDVSSHGGKVANEQIDNAELLDLKPLLGEKLYTDLVRNAAETKYVALLDGGDYTYDGFDYKNPGVKLVLAAFAAARVRMFGSDKSTPFGNVQKDYRDAVQTTRARGKERYTADMQTGMELWRDVEAFLDRKSSTYEYWREANGCNYPRGRQKGFKLTHVR